MKIYTKTGDQGDTSLFGGGRVKKNDPRVCAYGDVDELNSFVGLLIASINNASINNASINDASIDNSICLELKEDLCAIQNRLFDLGSELATGNKKFLEKLPRRIDEKDTLALEARIDQMSDILKPLKNFILPGGSTASAHAHVCRSVSRRVERSMLSLDECDARLITFINRVSDYFFALARYLNAVQKVDEPVWEK